MNRTIAFCLAVTLMLAAATLPAQGPDRTKPPAIGPAPALKLPPIVKRQLPNGLRVWIVESHEVPVAQVNLVINGGAADDPDGQFGIASLTTAMLTEGAGTRNSLELADAIDFLGADLNATSGFDSMSVRLHVPVARLADALPLMADVALRPSFPAAELERLKRQRIISLTQSHDDPASVAAAAFARVLYHPGRFGTRLGFGPLGSEASLARMTVESVRAFYTAWFVPSSSVLIITGDVMPDRVMPLVERAFGFWSGKPPVTSGTGSIVGGQTGSIIGGLNGPPRNRREIYLIDKPGAAQSQIRIGLIGVPRSTRDYFPIQVLNTVLGGSFSSRLNMNLREAHGYTYGASSSFTLLRQPGPFTAAAGVQTDKTSESLSEFFKELNGILQPVPADELARAKNYLALRYPGGFETTADIARRLEDAFIYQLPDDYFARYIPSINAVTTVDVQRVAKERLPLDTVAVVVVGDRRVIEPGIRALNLGPIVAMTVDEIFGEQ